MDLKNFFVATLIVLLASLSASAQSKSGKKSKKEKRKVVISFEEDLIEGNMTGAELFLIMQKRQTRFSGLFELREDFIPEMYQNGEGIQ